MQLTGMQLLGAEQSAMGATSFRAFDPVKGSFLAPEFHEATEQEVAQAIDLAETAFDAFRGTALDVRGRFLERIAVQLEEVATPLVERAHQETGLPSARLDGELARTTGQLRMFAELVRQGAWQDMRRDAALPERAPQPRPELRAMRIPLGPVAVFGASNFPLAFSVAGGDTASALAAGCPVVAKGHPAHPGTSEIAGRTILAAAEACGLPEGVFSLVQGQSVAVGSALVQHPLVKAVAFTGSLAGGRALFDLAAARPEPIPVFAEMGSINPVFLMPGILELAAEELAEGYVNSLLLGTGQFCTNPGVVVAVKGGALDRFVQAAQEGLAGPAPCVMLTLPIKQHYLERQQTVASLPGVSAVVPAKCSSCENSTVSPALFSVDLKTWLEHAELSSEIFGPAAILVVCDHIDQFQEVARNLQGQLTATLHAAADEVDSCAPLVRLLERKAGRLVFNGFPTGVEVCGSMVHGGPYPATTDSRFTSVGGMAVERFLRPVCFQNLPFPLLPEALQQLGE